MSSSPAPSPRERHDQGVYYTPAELTRTVVDLTLGATLAERREAAQRAASVAAWEGYREELTRLRVLDPACGAGVFLTVAQDVLRREHERVNAALGALGGGGRDPFDVDGAVLRQNLFGIDISAEAVARTRRALRARVVPNVLRGDSIVGDPEISPAAFDWGRDRFREGFDVVIGNPPYVRHELLTRLKDYLRRTYVSYHGMADLYVYFFERALSVLKPGGRLGFIVSNKWLRAGYAAPLRRLLAARAAIESVIDFGHAPLFGAADAFPCVVQLRKLGEGEAVAADHTVSVTDLSRHRHGVPQRRLGEAPWRLEPAPVDALMTKIAAIGVPLSELAGVKPYYGIKTGCNEAFFVDEARARALLREDPRSGAIIRRCLRGQDIDRWHAAFGGTYLIGARHGIDIEGYPAVKRHLLGFRRRLEPRPPGTAQRGWTGRRPGPHAWYELQDPVAYWDRLLEPKIIYQVIQFHPRFALDEEGLLLNDKAFFIPTRDPWLLAVLGSPLMWWHNHRYLGRMKDEALNPAGVKMERLPIAAPDDEARRGAEEAVLRLVRFKKEDQEQRAAALEALRNRVGVASPGRALGAFETLSLEAFVAAVARRRRAEVRGEVSSGDLDCLRGIYEEHARAIQDRRRQALVLERRLSELVNRAYGLTPEEVELIWATAPARMPSGR